MKSGPPGCGRRLPRSRQRRLRDSRFRTTTERILRVRESSNERVAESPLGNGSRHIEKGEPMKQTFTLLAMVLLPVAGAYSLDRPQEIRAAILLEDSGSPGARPRVREVGANESFYSGDRFQ